MLITWMKTNNCKSWSEGLRFVQLMKNRAYHDGIKRSPYMAMFGTDVKIGLSSSLLPAEAVEKLTTEQELEEILQSVVSDYEQNDNHNDKEDSTVSTSCCESCGCTFDNEQTTICGLCDKKNTIENERSNSKLSLEQQANKKKFRSINKFPPCNVGDTVRVKLPEVDRSKGDPQNILFAVVSISDDQYYELGNKNGTLHQIYSRNQFTVCSEPLIDILEVLATKKSLREIANVQSFSGGQGFKKCLCKTKCLTNKCKCKSEGILCNSKCHPNSNCSNK